MQENLIHILQYSKGIHCLAIFDVRTSNMRKAICKLRLSAHNLLTETGRYVKPKSMPRSERSSKHCNLNLIENEFHFHLQCSLYEPERKNYMIILYIL